MAHGHGHGSPMDVTAVSIPSPTATPSTSAYMNEALAEQTSAVKVAVIGAGFLGRCVALDLSLLGVSVFLCDSNADATASLAPFAYELLNPMLHLGCVTKSMITRACSNIQVVQEISECSAVSLVIEAIPDDLQAKVQLFRTLEAVCPSSTILSTSTISLSVDAIQKQLQHPERFLGLRFFHPCVLVPPVEVTVGQGTTQPTVDTVTQLLQRMQKVPHRGPTRRVLTEKEVSAFQFDTAVAGGFYHGLLEPRRLPVHEIVQPADGPPLDRSGRESRGRMTAL